MRVIINIYGDIAKIQFPVMFFDSEDNMERTLLGGFSMCTREQSSTIMPSFNTATIFSFLFPNFSRLLVENFIYEIFDQGATIEAFQIEK